MNTEYSSYAAAIDTCIALAEMKMRLLFQGASITSLEVMQLETQILKAKADCAVKRNSWVKARDAHMASRDAKMADVVE